MFFDFFSFVMPQNKNWAFHVTPHLSKIKESGAIVPRNLLDYKQETLGGFHDSSFSAYNNIENACNTVLFLNLIRILTQDEMSLDEINFIVEKSTGKQIGSVFMDNYLDGRYTPSEFALQICFNYGCKNPIVLTKSLDVDPKDLGIIAFPIRQKYLFLESWSHQSEKNMPFLENEGFRKVTDTEYSRFDTGVFGHSDIYNVIANSNNCFNPLDVYFNSQNQDGVKLAAKYISASSSFYSDPIKKIEERTGKRFIDNKMYIDGFNIDLNPRHFRKSNSYLYNPSEHEYRFFSPEQLHSDIEIITLSDVLYMASERIGDPAYPLFWPYEEPDLSEIISI